VANGHDCVRIKVLALLLSALLGHDFANGKKRSNELDLIKSDGC
jgi:hypothetical protein